MAVVKQIPLTPASFLKKLREIAQDSHRVIITLHAKQRMRERRINTKQVFECLRTGQIAEPVHKTLQGDWKATLEYLYAGDLVRVVVALEQQEDGDFAVVVTVMD